MKCTYFHRDCWIKIAQNDRSHAMDISGIAKAIISYGTMLSQPKYHIHRRKTVTGSLKLKVY